MEDPVKNMFPAHARRAPRSLVQISMDHVIQSILEMCEDRPNHLMEELRGVRRYIRRHLPYHVLTDMFNIILPTDPWTHPCSDKRYGNFCQFHQECRVVSIRLPHIIHVLFSEDIQKVHISLRKVKPKLYASVIEAFNSVFTKLPRRDFKLLVTFVIQSGGKLIEDCIPEIEELAYQLKEQAENLIVLHLPIVSNTILAHIANMKSLKVFRSDRSKHVTSRGMNQLCHKDSVSKYQLEVLHIGIFKHKGFTKDASTNLLRFMESLKEISFRDQDRMVTRSPWLETDGRGDKVLAYSVFKLAIKQHEMKDNQPWPGGRIGPDLLATNLRHLHVVDRVLKPHYILESAPKLTSLTIDWQEDYRPVSGFPQNWFREMIGKKTWSMLASKLTSLAITFPAAYTPNAYSLSPQDFTILMNDLGNLTHLKLEGAGMNGPFPIVPVLKLCPSLVSLILKNTPVHVPHQDEAIREEYRHRKLKTFHLLDDLSSLTFHTHLTSILATYMPMLEELDISPKNVREFEGFTCEQVLELSRLSNLRCLGITFSTSDCTSNMPQVVYTLKEFNSLRNLVISWGFHHSLASQNCPIPVHLITWLVEALVAFNANINIQVSIKHHPKFYAAPGGGDLSGYLNFL